ncbi:hypothetical protein ACKFKG_08990 [Phormidesmis sp. 146-35]
MECSQSLTDSQDVVISCTIAEDFPLQNIPHPTSNLHMMVKLGSLDFSIAQQIHPISLPLNYNCTVTDPALLHLVQLLQTEIQAPQVMSEIVVSSIATVLTTHLLHAWQTEACKH